MRALANKIVRSPTVKDGLEEACCEAHIDSKSMVRDVDTQWNSAVEMVARGLEIKAALKILVLKADFNKPHGVRLRRFQLSTEEWDLLEQLEPLLEVSLYVFRCFLTYKAF